MNKKCENCHLRDLPDSLRNKINAMLGINFFINCPLPEGVFGCIRKFNIDLLKLKEMTDFLKRNKIITEEEEIYLEKKFGA